MHYYKRNIGDYAKKAGRLTMLQHGAYTLLLDACYDREQFPTREEAIDWLWASSTAEIEAVDFVLSKFFTLEDGRYLQNRIREELAGYHEKSENNRRIAQEREANRRNKSTKRVQDVNEVPPNQEPLTTNQEPLHKEEANASLSKARLPTCPKEEIISVYHEVLPELPGVRVMDKKREKAITEFWKWVLTSKKPDGTRRAEDAESAISWIRAYFERARSNDFLMGRGLRTEEHKNWRCSIEYLLSTRGLKKVIEETSA